MVREAYSGQAGSGNRITNVTADYIAKGLTAALNPPKWRPYQARYSSHTWGVESDTQHIRLYAVEGGGVATPITKAKAQELADILNKAEFDA
jgi:hypothetical protein